MTERTKKVGDYYPITTIKYPGGSGSINLILDSHLKDYTPPYQMESLNHFLRGQTRAPEGTYAGDVERWMNNLPVVD